MRVAYVTAKAPTGDGETFILTEIRAVCRQGVEVIIVPCNPWGRRSRNAEACALSDRTVTRALASPRVFAAFIRSFVLSPMKVLRAFGALRGCRSTRVFLKNLVVFPKAVWFADFCRQRDVNHVHAHWLSTSSTMAMVASEITGIPWSVTGHRWDLYENNLIERKLRSARFVRVISRQGETHLNKIAIGQVKYLPMGVDIPSRDGARVRTEGDMLRIITAANLIPVKGIGVMIAAAAVLRERGYRCEFHIAGDGPLRRSLQHQVDSNDLGGFVKLLGRIDHSRLIRDMTEGRWDIAVLPSIITNNGEHEGVPVFLMEAMAAGLPVVATFTGGIPELVSDDCGFLCPPEDYTSLADVLCLLAQDIELRIRMGRRGRTRILKYFQSDRVVKELCRLFANGSENAPQLGCLQKT